MVLGILRRSELRDNGSGAVGLNGELRLGCGCSEDWPGREVLRRGRKAWANLTSVVMEGGILAGRGVSVCDAVKGLFVRVIVAAIGTGKIKNQE